MSDDKRPERCELCRFWEDAFDEPPIGSCHRYPPTPLVHPNEDPYDYDFQYVFPESSPNDWCGEFQPGLLAPQPADDDRWSNALSHKRGVWSSVILAAIRAATKQKILLPFPAVLPDLCLFSASDLLAERQFGPRILAIVREELAKHGLKLKGD